jgi:AraC family transcriptional regulator
MSADSETASCISGIASRPEPPGRGRTGCTSDDKGSYVPILARTRTIRAGIAPVAYDCVRLIFVRSGSAILLSEFGERPVAFGDVVALGSHTLCGSEPEESITVTTIYLGRDYLADQVFWQHG